MKPRILCLIVFTAISALLFASTIVLGARPAAISWSPTTSPGTYDYGTMPSGQTASQTFTVRNSGGAATGMLSVSLSSSQAFVITSDLCSGTALGPGKSCNVSVQFTAGTAGQPDTATLTVIGKRPPTGPTSITLKGAAAASVSALVLQPPANFHSPDGNGTNNYDFHFGAVPSGSQAFTVTNQGTVASNSLSVQVVPGYDHFTVSGDACSGNPLASNASCSFMLTFTAPAGCTSGAQFNAPILVLQQDNGYPYIELAAIGTCP